MPPGFRELSSIDQFRVLRSLTRGEAPHDSRLAAITLDTAKRYQTDSRLLAALFRWLPIVMAILLVVETVPGALDGQVGMMILFAVAVLGVIGNVMLNPWTRPQNVGRSMEASRRIVAQIAASQSDRDMAL